MYIDYEKLKLFKQKKYVIEEKLNQELNKLYREYEKNTNNLISYHSIAGDLARVKEDKKEK